MVNHPIIRWTVLLTASVCTMACSNSSTSSTSSNEQTFLETYTGQFKTVLVSVVEDKCNMGATNDENPQVGDTLRAYLADDGIRLITDECLPPQEPNCIDHFPEQWTEGDGFVENKHVDDLYEGNPEKPEGECHFTAYSHWKAVMKDNTMQVTLTIRADPNGKDCTSFETKLVGCEIVLLVMLERQ